MKKILFAISLLVVAVTLRAEEEKPNKLKSMYRLYYLSMGIDFKEAETQTDLLPFIESAPGRMDRLLKPEELEAMDREWANIKQDWQKKSLLLKNPADLGKSVTISQTLRNHYVRANRSANEIVSIGSEDSGQTKLLKSLMQQPNDDLRTHFFIVGPDWCLSSMEYRIIVEGLLKEFQDPKFVLHNVMIADPDQNIFESKFLKEVLPDTKTRKLETVPVFLALSFKNGKPQIFEEAEAIDLLLKNHLLKHRGFLKGKSANKPSFAKSP